MQECKSIHDVVEDPDVVKLRKKSVEEVFIKGDRHVEVVCPDFQSLVSKLV